MGHLLGWTYGVNVGTQHGVKTKFNIGVKHGVVIWLDYGVDYGVEKHGVIIF